MVDPLPDRPRKGRGAIGNPSGRYEPRTRQLIDDGWAEGAWAEGAWAEGAWAEGGWAGAEAGAAPALATEVGIDSSRTVIARNSSPDVPFDRSINPYRGCEHGCIYCFARPSHAYLGLSPGLDFETRIFAKPEAAKRLSAELAKPSYAPAVIAMGTNTDPYQPVERRLEITRSILKVLAAARHPVAIVTKSNLVLRDLDILTPMAEARLARVLVSVTTLDPTLARKLEPRAARPTLRLETIRRLAEAGVPTGVLAAPMIPGLNDDELEAILEAAALAGGTSAGYILLRLPLEIKALFIEWLEAHFPDRKKRVLALLRATRRGKLYDPAFGTRMTGEGVYAQLLARRFELACGRLDLKGKEWDLDVSQFVKPSTHGEQLALF
ncbi:MAG: PA0069 family radical SAM protein [Alphaproteobacteria bacterium]